eukprot:1047649-Amphidinium_carterae.2
MPASDCNSLKRCNAISRPAQNPSGREHPHAGLPHQRGHTAERRAWGDTQHASIFLTQTVPRHPLVGCHVMSALPRDAYSLRHTLATAMGLILPLAFLKSGISNEDWSTLDE